MLSFVDFIIYFQIVGDGCGVSRLAFSVVKSTEKTNLLHFTVYKRFMKLVSRCANFGLSHKHLTLYLYFFSINILVSYVYFLIYYQFKNDDCWVGRIAFCIVKSINKKKFYRHFTIYNRLIKLVVSNFRPQTIKTSDLKPLN